MTASEAFANTRAAMRGDEELKLRREEFNNQKKQRDQELQMAGYDPNTLAIKPGSAADVQQLQNDQNSQMLTALQGKLSAQDTDQAILDFSETGDANYLQNALDKNPKLKQAWGKRGVMQVGNIDWQNDTNILAQAGFQPSEYDTEEKQNIIKKNAYKVYDGQNWKVGLLNNVVAEAGVLDRVGMNRGQKILDNYQSFRDFMAGPRSSANTAEGHKYEKDIMAASEATGVPANLLAAMMNIESSNNPNAVSPKGAKGLMQLMPDTANELGVRDVTNPSENIMGGAKYMAKLLEKYNGNTRLALAAYNAGPAVVDKYGDVPPYSETQNHVKKVLNNYAIGESYYDAGSPDGNDPDKQLSREDSKINTILKFKRDLAAAEKGTSVEEEARKTDAQIMAANAKIAQANTRLLTGSTTAKQKELAAAEDQTNELLNKFGGDEKFFATDFSDSKNFNKAWQDVVKINKLEGTELTNTDKTNITDMRELIALSDPASQITDEQTGLFDKQLTGLSKYIDEGSKGAERTSAMAAFRNSLRNALYGATLTDGEIAAFNDAYGDNKQKLGPVLAQFKTSLLQLQAKLDSTMSLNNPYTMHVMMGADRNKLIKVRMALQQRIDYISGRTDKQLAGNINTVGDSAGGGTSGSGNQQGNRRPLDAIFKGGQ